MKMLTVDTLEEVRRKLKECMSGQRLTVGYVPLLQCQGLCLAENLYAKAPIPGYRRSTVDGYGVCAKDTQGASEHMPVLLNAIGEVLMGARAGVTIEEGQCAYVPTGGMIPDGADAMVMVEFTEPFGESEVAVYEAVPPGKAIVSIGEDAKEGELLLAAGRILGAKEIGAIAAAGIKEVPVYEPFKVTIISTGDELASLEEPLMEGQIYDVNTYALAAQAKEMGMSVVSIQVLVDEEQLIRDAASDAAEKSDFVIISGGSSQGKKDVTAKIIDEVAVPGVLTHGIALKPGKPTILGHDEQSQTLFLGLPGHPVAAMMVFELLAGWLTKELTGRRAQMEVMAAMEVNVASAQGKTTCQLVQLLKEASGYIARPVFGKSGLISTLTMADGYTLIEMNKEGLKAGETVTVTLLR